MKKPKYSQRRVLSTRDPQQTAAFYAATDADAPLTGRQRAVGIVQHPETSAWQVWMSTNGLDVISVAAASTEENAEALYNALKSFLRSSECCDEGQSASFFAQLAAMGDAKPQALPDGIVRQIGRAIQCRALEMPG